LLHTQEKYINIKQYIQQKNNKVSKVFNQF
jgi:hypothetical protein